MRTLARSADRAALRVRLAALRPDAARRWGRMTAHQMVCHVADAFLMYGGEKATLPTVTFARRVLLKPIVLFAPLRWPPGIASSPELAAEGGGTRPGDFAADLARADALLAAFAADPAGAAQAPHPFFGSLTWAEWLRWGWLHTDHHLRQFGL